MTTYWTGDVPAEDQFGDRIDQQFVDGRTHFGPWAIMTIKSHRRYGMGLGTDKGQLYERQSMAIGPGNTKIRWVKIAG